MNHAQFVELWKSGDSAKVIAKKLRIAESSVYTYACKHREECPSRKSKVVKVVDKEEPVNEVATTKSTSEDSAEKLSIEQILDKSFSEEDSEANIEKSVEENIDNRTDTNIISDLALDTVVIDTSSLADIRTFKIIEHAKRVIISSVVLREINKLKDTINDLKLKHNFQKVLKESTLDSKNEKYVITNFLRQNNECNDESIARNAAEINNAVVITRDYGLCCFCKLYNVKYLFISDETISFVDNTLIPEVDIDNKDTRPFYLSRDYNELFITCLTGTIEIQHEKNSIILFPNEKAKLFMGDHVTIKVKKESRFLVRYSKGKLVLYPLT